MKRQSAEQYARHFFEELGFEINKIPETEAKRADLTVEDGCQEYIVEVKEKLDTGSQLSELPNRYPTSDRTITREPHAASNRLDGILKDARKQLAATPGKENAVRLVYLSFLGPNADMFGRRALYTIYGVQDLLPVSGGPGVNCVYFRRMGKAVYDPATFDQDASKIVLRSTVSRTERGPTAGGDHTSPQ